MSTDTGTDASAPAGERPSMTAGYGISADAAGLLPWSHAEERLVAARNYWVATVGPDRRPHATPVWGLWRDGALYFSADSRSRKGRNIAANPRVAVHLKSGDDAVMLEGMVERELDPETLSALTDPYEAKYGYRMDFANPDTPMYVLRPELILAWLEADFPHTATRWRFTGGERTTG